MLVSKVKAMLTQCRLYCSSYNHGYCIGHTVSKYTVCDHTPFDWVLIPQQLLLLERPHSQSGEGHRGGLGEWGGGVCECISCHTNHRCLATGTGTTHNHNTIQLDQGHKLQERIYVGSQYNRGYMFTKWE